ncbi:MAG TPA: PLP-dependent aspartate aminotransferase family protein [Candidatus Marinimicrobia bacterium]|jgi:cystathionine beta-lyase/cystathionine gamma-synthase|nr:PLP-dependent aspartate aminotransferase family protein [Candidatus Neomarinimicrobiota bacterium]MDP7475111.1 PLP-dependent aspartate aminotransferase family protein [Candidatus Neomarinimicrobiota bacterium]MDP7526390.1 PLP-dependent aspartate aminotransferase family protein [Candidatus Neomarinimicrobiota bacterium]MEE1507077.1 PLP-dependent aspartate aminotransferase family protein [Candidatus Neomarinimicrobiota bacterium]MEE1573287.1 PLP-dependent aspartate aminotransferase family prot
MKFDTKVVRAGIEPDPTTGAIVPPIYQTATYVLPEVGRDLGFDYTRSANPTREILENNLATIEGGRFGTCFSSGMSAVDSVLKLLKKGDHVVCSDDVYGGVSRHFNNILVNYGLTFTYVDSSNPENVENAITSETKLFWIETPTNPLLKITDLNAISKIAKKHRILFGVDSTFATPVFLRPFEFGADIVMHSTTKYISGHNQLIGGIIITNDEEIHERMKFVQKTIGAVPSPFDCWLTLIGAKTLHLRMERHASNAQAVAEFLESHPQVEKITYPGLKSHPQYGVAKEQMDGFSGMISFELKGGIPAGTTVMNNVKLCSLAESLGAVETMITHPATMTHVDVPAEERYARGLTDGLVRISVGIEDPDDIIDDLKQALEKV